MPARLAKIDRRDPDAVLVGGLGCHAGGYARSEQLHSTHLSKIGKHGANTRWGNPTQWK